MPAEIGQPAPDFTLPDQQNNKVSLSDFKGKKTLLVFIPFPFSGPCSTELCAIRDDYPELQQSGDNNIVVITCDQRHANRVWTEQNNFQFPILADYWPHGEVARKYGAFSEANGAATRMSFVIDADGVIRDIIKSDELLVPREHAAYARSLVNV